MRLAIVPLLLCLLSPLTLRADDETIPPPPPDAFGYPGNIGPSRGWYVWHKYDPQTREVEVSRDPPVETWKAKVLPWCTTYRYQSYGALPEELLPGERVNVFFNPDGKTKWGYVVHFQDELSQMRGHNHAWQVREVEPGDRWFRASLWMGNEKKLSDDVWSFWIDIDCEKWIGGKRVETFPLKIDDHLWMTWVWQNGQRVVKRIVDAESCETLKKQQEARTRWRLIDEGIPGIAKGTEGDTSRLLIYSTYWSQARQFKPGMPVELLPGNYRQLADLSPGTNATIESVKFGGTYSSGPTDVAVRFTSPAGGIRTLFQKPDTPIVLRARPGPAEQAARSLLIAAANAMPGDDPGTLSPATLDAWNRILATVTDAEFKGRLMALVPELKEAALRRLQRKSLKPAIDAGWGTLEMVAGGPEWLRDIVGNSAMQVFDRVQVVDLFDKRIVAKSGKRTADATDAWIVRLKDLPDIEYLELASTAVTNEGMKTVGTLKSLQRLSVTLTDVDGRGIAELSGLTNMRRISVASSKCTGEGFAALQPLTKLENLNFHSCLVNDAGLAEVGTLSSLERLEIVHTKFTDAGAKHLAGLTNLRRLQIGSREATGASVEFIKALPIRELDLHDGQASDLGLEHASALGSLRILRIYGPVTDRGVAHLARLEKLEQLILSHAPVTDAGLKSLHGLKRLTNVDLTGCKVSDDAVAAWKAAVPGVVVKR